jgi:NAD-dependent SIR2 family protein deacetylase
MFDPLIDFFSEHESIFVLTGAGVSTASGIPDYRDEKGAWKHSKPMEYRDFVATHEARQRYWARSHTVTQNVDGLHQRAGSRRLTELHGSLDSVECLGCGAIIPRATMQQQLLAANPVLAYLSARVAPDGDADLDGYDETEVLATGSSPGSCFSEKPCPRIESRNAMRRCGVPMQCWCSVRR